MPKAEDKKTIVKICRQEILELLKTKDKKHRERTNETYFDKLRLLMTLFPS